MLSPSGSRQPSRSPVRRVAVFTHRDAERVRPALARLEQLAGECGVEVTAADPDLVVVLGGDGTMLRALTRFLGTRAPVIGVNYGRVGFLTSMGPDGLEEGLRRVFAGEYVVHELPTISVEVADARFVAVNDVVVASTSLGRMIELSWAVGGEDLGALGCDAVVAATPSGSTAYNFSNGGPVLVWGLDALVVTFVAPHSLRTRPLVVPRGTDVVVRNVTEAGHGATVLADGHEIGAAPPGQSLRIRLDEERTLLASLPEVTFFTRYHDTFSR
jgi:NAD+ kinase